jgi:hypothetical protein
MNGGDNQNTGSPESSEDPDLMGELDASAGSGKKQNIEKRAFAGQRTFEDITIPTPEELEKLPVVLNESIQAYIDTGEKEPTLRLDDLFTISKIEIKNEEPPYIINEGMQKDVNKERYRLGPMGVHLKTMELEYAFGQDTSIPINKSIEFVSDPGYDSQRAFINEFSMNVIRVASEKNDTRLTPIVILDDIIGILKTRISPKSILTGPDAFGDEKEIPERFRGPTGITNLLRELINKGETEEAIKFLKSALPYFQRESGTIDDVIQYTHITKSNLHGSIATMSPAEKDIARRVFENIEHFVENEIIRRGLRYDSSGEIRGDVNTRKFRRDPMRNCEVYYDITYVIPKLSNFSQELTEVKNIIKSGYHGGEPDLKGKKIYGGEGNIKGVDVEKYTILPIDNILKNEQLKLFKMLAEKINTSNSELYEEGLEIEKKLTKINRKKNRKGKFGFLHNTSRNRQKDEALQNAWEEHKEKYIALIKTEDGRIRESPEETGDFYMRKDVWENYKKLTSTGIEKFSIETLIVHTFFEKNPKFAKMFAGYEGVLVENLRYHTTRYERIAAQFLINKGFTGRGENQRPEKLIYYIPQGQDGADFIYTDTKGNRHFMIGERYTEGSLDVEEDAEMPHADFTLFDRTAEKGKKAAAKSGREYSRTKYVITATVAASIVAAGAVVWNSVITRDMNYHKTESERKSEIISEQKKEIESIKNQSKWSYNPPADKRGLSGNTGITEPSRTAQPSLEQTVDTCNTGVARDTGLPKDSAAYSLMDSANAYETYILLVDKGEFAEANKLNRRCGPIRITGKDKAKFLAEYGYEPSFWEKVGANHDFSDISEHATYSDWISYSADYKIRFQKKMKTELPKIDSVK